MPLSRKAKIAMSIVAVPIFLLAAGVIVLKVMFTSERLKSMVIPVVEETTGREVSIGDVSLGVFPTIALKMEDVTISNRETAGFSPKPFVTLAGLRVNVKLLPLLSSRLDVTSLVVEEPRLRLEVNAAGETNYSNLMTGGKIPDTLASGTGAPDSSMAAALAVSEFLVTRGFVEYVDYRDSSVIGLRGVSLSTEVGGEGGAIAVTGNAVVDSLSYGTISSSFIEGLRVTLGHRILYSVVDDRVRIEKGDVTLQNLRLDLSGTIGHASKDPVLDLTVGSDSLNIADLFSLIPGEYRKKTEGLKGAGVAQVHIAVTGTLTDTTSAAISGTIRARDASIQYPQLPKPITDINLLSRFTRSAANQEFQIEELRASLGGAPIRMAMTVTAFDDPFLKLSASGSLDLAKVREYYPLDEGTELGGVMQLDVRLAGRVANPQALRAEGSLGFHDVTLTTAALAKPVRNLNGTISLNNEVVESKKVALRIGGSDMTLAFRMKNYLSVVSDDAKAPQATASMSLQSNRLVVSDIVGEEKAGRGGAVSSPAGKKEPAALPDVDMDVHASIGTLTTEKFEFTNVRGTLHISNGVITMQNLSLNAFGGSVVSTGLVNLTDPQQTPFDLKLTVNAVQARSLLSPFTSFGQRLNGAMSMNTELTGALNDTMGLVTNALRGGGTVSLREGNLQGLKINQSLASALSLPDLETVKFKDWGNAFTVENGRLVIKDMTINASNAEYVVNGSQGLDGSLDYRLALRLPESAGSRIKVSGFAGEALNLFKDQNGQFVFDFNIGGTMDGPKLQLDTAPAKRKVEDQAKAKLEAEKQKLQEKLKEKTGDALKKIFKK